MKEPFIMKHIGKFTLLLVIANVIFFGFISYGVITLGDHIKKEGLESIVNGIWKGENNK